MNNDDERDYEEEAANGDLIRAGDEPTVEEKIEAIRRQEHAVILTAGPWCYVYAGADRQAVADAAALGAFGMTGANLDTDLTWIQPEHFHEIYRRLGEKVGADNVMLMDLVLDEAR